MDEQQKLAHESAQDTTKQLLGLATGIIALTITFGKDFIGTIPDPPRHYALWAWAAFLLSVCFGMWTLMALTGTLEAAKGKSTAPSIWGSNVTLPASLQVLAFLVGLGLTVLFGWRASQIQTPAIVPSPPTAQVGAPADSTTSCCTRCCRSHHHGAQGQRRRTPSHH